MSLVDGGEFITVDERTSRAGFTVLRRQPANRRFHVPLHAQPQPIEVHEMTVKIDELLGFRP